MYFVWSLDTGRNIVRRDELGGSAICAGDFWPSVVSGCRGSLELAWVELVIAGLVVLGLAWLAARWVVAPLRVMTDTVAQLGPTSLGVRLRPIGPRDEARRLAEAI